MVLRLARTNAEAHLYMELHACEVCGSRDYHPESSVIMLDGDLASRYEGRCGSCGAERVFAFRIPERILPPAGADEVRFGDDRPSELLDPGEWLWVADAASSRIPGDTAGMSASERAAWRHSMATAVGAMDEVLKFIPEGSEGSGGSDGSYSEEVPESAFTSELGRSVRAAEPGRFRRFRLAAVRDAYREVLAKGSV